MPRKKISKSRGRQLRVARAARGKKKSYSTDRPYEVSQSSASSSDESSGESQSQRKVTSVGPAKVRPAKVRKIESVNNGTKTTARPTATTLPWNVPSKPSIIVRHQKEETDQGSEGNRAPISHLSEADFKSLVDLIKRQRCCGCSGANLLLELHGSSTDTGISPELLNRISRAIS